MSSSFRRYELLLPVKFNDGKPAPSELFLDTIFELRSRFGAVTVSPQPMRGEWQHEGKVYADELVRYFVDVPDTAANRAFFVKYKRRLKKRFQQIDIWMTTYPLEVI